MGDVDVRADEQTEVVVVGAGLSGLRCARALLEAGREVVVLDAADAVGGRVRSDHVDGFTADHGFQLLNPAYPAVRRWVDVDALGLQAFGAGVVAHDLSGDGRRAVLGDPLREPGTAPGTVSSLLGAGGVPRDAVALARWAAPLLRDLATPTRRPLASRLDPARDRTLTEALDAVGARGDLRRVLERFLAGVVLDDTGATSSHFVLLLLRSFLTGRPSLPRGGMAALPAQLAAPLGDRVRLGTRVTGLDRGPDGVLVHTAAGTVGAREVVVAADPVGAADLTGTTAPTTRGVLTCWWATDEAPTANPLLHVDGAAVATGPVVNTAVVSHAAPSYAPPGRHLVQASALLGPGRGAAGSADHTAPAEADVRRHAARLLGAPAGSEQGWELVVRHVVPVALPAQPPPLRTARAGGSTDARGPDGPDGVVVAGDHRETASIQGALVSGDVAARAVLRRLAGA